jgi:hypothetical protein
MYMLRIEHPVPNFEGWKRAFDGDPVGREKSGVRRYQILRAVNDPNYVMVDLEFDTAKQAKALLAAIRCRSANRQTEPKFGGPRPKIGLSSEGIRGSL